VWLASRTTLAAAVPIGKAFADALPDFLKGPGGAGKTQSQIAREAADAAVAAARSTPLAPTLLDRGGRETGVAGSLQGKLRDDKIAGSVRLEKKSSGSSVQNVPHDLIGVMERENEHPGAGIILYDLPGRFQTVQAGHANIQNDRVRFQLTTFPQRHARLRPRRKPARLIRCNAHSPLRTTS
jgi:hypothetical protein